MAKACKEVLLVVLIAVLGVAAGQTCSNVSGVPGDFDVTLPLMHLAQPRRFRLHVPASYSSTQPMPVVFAFHGGGSDWLGHSLQTGWTQVSDSQGFIVIYGRGTAFNETAEAGTRTWNAGSCCSYAQATDANEIAYFDAVLEYVTASYCIDRQGIYASGHSNGAMLSYKLACLRSTVIAAVAPCAAPMAQLDLDSCGVECEPASETQALCLGPCPNPTAYFECNPERNVPILHFHGILDSHAPLLGGSGVDSVDPHIYKPVATIINEFAVTRYGCDNSTVQTYSETLSQDDSSSCNTYTGCDANTNVTLCITSVGHSWPGGKYPLVACDQSNPDTYAPVLCALWIQQNSASAESLDGTSEAWSFFMQNPLPSSPTATTSASTTTTSTTTATTPTGTNNDTADESSASSTSFMVATWISAFSLFTMH